MKMTVTDWLFGRDGALFRAAALGKPEMTAELIGRGANARISSRRGITPLHRAAQNGYTEIAELLLDAGADPEANAHSGETPLSMAESGGHDAIVALLRARIDAK